MKLTMEEVANILGIEIPDHDEWDFSDTYHYCYEEAKSEGKSDEEAGEYAMECLSEELDKAIKIYNREFESVAEDWFGKVGLDITEKNGAFTVKPQESWNKVLTEIREIVNGVGYFHFSSNKQLIDSGPYKSAKDCVANHIGYISTYGEVYGAGSPSKDLQRSLESAFKYM